MIAETSSHLIDSRDSLIVKTKTSEAKSDQLRGLRVAQVQGPAGTTCVEMKGGIAKGN